MSTQNPDADKKEKKPGKMAKKPQKPGETTKEIAKEIGGPEGPEPTRYGDWEVGGRCSDF